jgi:hypothetical protein
MAAQEALVSAGLICIIQNYTILREHKIENMIKIKKHFD